MSDPNDFIIENGVLKKYKGPGGDVVIPEGVTSIGDWVFSGCSSLMSVTIPASVTSIGSSAFKHCRRLMSVTIPEGVTSIGESAFYGCNNLTSVTIPEGVTSIGEWTFTGCRGLMSVTIPETVTSIGGSAFSGCTGLTSIIVPESVTSIGDKAFEGCDRLTSVTIQEGVTSIGKEAFSNCRRLTSVTIPESVTSIGGSAFKYCGLHPDAAGFVILGSALCSYHGPGGDVVIPEGVKIIGDRAFEYCDRLTSVTIPAGVTSIGEKAFYSCDSMTSVTIPVGVTGIGKEAFRDCSSLTSVTIPESVTSIGGSAFSGCSNLTSVTIPESVTSIGDYAFYDCRLHPDAAGFVILGSFLHSYHGPGGDVVIPANVTEIGESAFKDCTGLTNVTIPERVTRIRDQVFFGCTGLTSVTIPEGVASIGGSAFFKCSSLKSVAIPESVTSIGSGAFSGCSSLTSVVIPEGVTSIGDSAFYGCRSLTNVTIPEGVTSIGDSAFQSCTSLERIELSSLNASFGSGLFEDCDKLLISLPADSVRTNQKLPVPLSIACRGLEEEDLAWVLLYQKEKSWKTAAISAAKEKDATQILQKQLELIGGMKKLSAAAATNVLDFCMALGQNVPTDQLKAFAALLKEKNCTKQLAALEANLTLQQKLLGSEAAAAAISPVERKVMEQLDAEGLTNTAQLFDKLHSMLGVKADELPSLTDTDGRTCNPIVLAWLLTAHEKENEEWQSVVIRAAWGQPGLRPEAAEVTALLEPESLQAAIMNLADQFLVKYQNTKKKFLVYPFCRYASEASMAALTTRAPKWATGVSGIDAPPLLQLRDAVRYSDTRAAMLFVERYHELDKYAAVRGMSEDELRDKYLSDVGLDEQGGKVYDLGSQTVTARLQKDLSFLFELPNGKTAKSLPKKGADEEKYNAAKADFDEMRKAVKKILKSRGAVLFEDFLSGRKRSSEEWQSAYMPNPVLRLAAGLVVWSQGERTFTLSDGVPIDSAGNAYAFTGEEIKVAHPMEMQAENVKAWQRYYNARGLKQPFAQVWEPVADPAAIKADRYAGSVLPMYCFSNRGKHGIYSGSLYAYSDNIGFRLDDCTLDFEPSTWRIGPLGAESETYTLGKFSFKKYTRKVNHIISLLDAWTVEDRLKKDDISVMDLMSGFTLAQITEFIKTAQEANAVNVLALLLEYKNVHFADFDPMDEFTLEW